MSSFSIMGQTDPEAILESYDAWLEEDVYGDYILLDLNDPSYLSKLSFWQAENVRRHIRDLVNSEDKNLHNKGVRMQTVADLISRSLHRGFFYLNNSLVRVNYDRIEKDAKLGCFAELLQTLDENTMASFIAIQCSMSQGVSLLMNRLFLDKSIFELVLKKMQISESQWAKLYEVVKNINKTIKIGWEDLLSLLDGKDFISCYYIGLLHLYYYKYVDESDIDTALKAFMQCEKYADFLSVNCFLYDEMLIMKAECYYLQKNFDDAVKTLKPIISHSTKAELRTIKYLSAINRTGEKKEALKLFKSLVEDNIYILVQVLDDLDVLNNEYIFKFVEEYRDGLLKEFQNLCHSEDMSYEHIGILDLYQLIQNLKDDSNVIEQKKNEESIRHEHEIQKGTPNMIDLGLPSGNLWADRNVGSDEPWSEGGYYAWGESTSKIHYSIDTYSYVTNAFFVDVANKNWGGEWRMPTIDDWEELINNTTREWCENYNGSGVKGYILTSVRESHANVSIFLPAAGCYKGRNIEEVGRGYYCSSSFPMRYYAVCSYASLSPVRFGTNAHHGYIGYTVRPVCSSQDYTNEHDAVDLGLPSGILWASCNIGANTPEEGGDYYSFGETCIKDEYTHETYKFDSWGLIKYNMVDNKKTLEAIDDVATQILGDEWCIPTSDDWMELINNTSRTWTYDFNGTGVAGCIFTSIVEGYTESFIFLPVGVFFGDHKSGRYWSSSISERCHHDGYSVFFNSLECSMKDFSSRHEGLFVRPVRRTHD